MKAGLSGQYLILYAAIPTSICMIGSLLLARAVGAANQEVSKGPV